MFELGGVATAVEPAREAALRLAAFDLAAGDERALLDALATIRRHSAFLAAVEASVLERLQAHAEAAANDPRDREWLSEDVGAVMQLRGDFARERMLTAAELVRRLPTTHALLADAAITPMQARLLAEAVVPLDDEACSKVESRVLVRAADQSTTQFRKSLNRAVLAAAPKSAEVAHDEAVSTRRVLIRPADHGMATLWALLPAPELMRLKTAVWQLAQSRFNADSLDDEAPCSIDAYRADALVELADRYLSEADATCVINREGPAVQIVVSLETLTGDSDEPAELVGHGAIPAGLARAIADDPSGTWFRLVTDPIGNLIDLSTEEYRPPKRLADFVQTRHRTCSFPSCNRRAKRCELDHVIPWPEGETCTDNLVPLCPRHHHLKHDGGWKITYDAVTGLIEWTSPTGRKYRNPRPD